MRIFVSKPVAYRPPRTGEWFDRSGLIDIRRGFGSDLWPDHDNEAHADNWTGLSCAGYTFERIMSFIDLLLRVRRRSICEFQFMPPIVDKRTMSLHE